MIDRRRFLNGAALLGGSAALQAMAPAWARSGAGIAGPDALNGNDFHLRVGRTDVAVDGRRGRAVTVNGRLPAPLLRWREGDTVTLRVTNELEEDTSIHWHGVLLPPEMDGVPGVSFPGVRPGETFTFRFPVKQAGTYWYHSHSGFQEQLGHYGPIIIEPKDADPVEYDREYVVVLSDWTFERPERLFGKLKKNPESLNYQKRTLIDFFGDGADFRDRAMWGAMRMDPTDIADVTAATYTYLVNGHGPGDNWTALVTPGERVRLRIINASAMTIFNMRLPGLPMTVVQADGLNVRPVETDEIQIGVAETYDVIIRPQEDKAYTLMAETIDRSGYARATLAPRMGMEAPVPPLRERPILTMADMAMAGHAGHGAAPTNGGAHQGMGHGAHVDVSRETMGHSPVEASDHADSIKRNAHSGHGRDEHGAHAPDASLQTHDHKRGAGVDMVAEVPSSRLADPGIGLESAGHRVLTYADLRALDMNPDMRTPKRELELHLTGNMHRYMWSFDGKKFSEVEGPIVFHEGERVRLTLVNDTMMNHPIHLHGMFFDVVARDDHDHHKARKHTIIVKPGEKLSVDITADAVGDWAFHCHLLYHMAAGMMQVVTVRPRGNGNDPHHDHHGADDGGRDMGSM